MSDIPKLSKITRINGVGGQIGYSVSVTYPGESADVVTFVGSVYGGPVIMVTPAGHQVPVSRDKSEQCGTFGPEWVRRFFQ